MKKNKLNLVLSALAVFALVGCGPKEPTSSGSSAPDTTDTGSQDTGSTGSTDTGSTGTTDTGSTDTGSTDTGSSESSTSEEPAEVILTVSEALAAAAAEIPNNNTTTAEAVKVVAKVVEISKDNKSVVLTDGVANMTAYNSTPAGVTLGSVYKVEGKIKNQYGVYQFNAPTFEAAEAVIEEKAAVAVDYAAAKAYFDAGVAQSSTIAEGSTGVEVKHVSFEAVAEKNGSYINLMIKDGANALSVSTSKVNVTLTEGKTYLVDGYFMETNSKNSYVGILSHNIVEKATAEFDAPKASYMVGVAANIGLNTTKMSGVECTLTSSSDAVIPASSLSYNRDEDSVSFTPAAEGKATITASFANGVSASVEINVIAPVEFEASLLGSYEGHVRLNNNGSFDNDRAATVTVAQSGTDVTLTVAIKAKGSYAAVNATFAYKGTKNTSNYFEFENAENGCTAQLRKSGSASVSLWSEAFVPALEGGEVYCTDSNGDGSVFTPVLTGITLGLSKAETKVGQGVTIQPKAVPTEAKLSVADSDYQILYKATASDTYAPMLDEYGEDVDYTGYLTLSNGYLTPEKAGYFQINLSKNTYKASTELHVLDLEAYTSISAAKTTLALEASGSEDVAITVVGGADDKLVVASTDSAVATAKLNTAGNKLTVTGGTKEGTATITVSSTLKPAVKASITVNVTIPSDGAIPSGMVGTWTATGLDCDGYATDDYEFTFNADGTGSFIGGYMGEADDFVLDEDASSGNTYVFIEQGSYNDGVITVTWNGSTISAIEFDDTVGEVTYQYEVNFVNIAKA